MVCHLAACSLYPKPCSICLVLIDLFKDVSTENQRIQCINDQQKALLLISFREKSREKDWQNFGTRLSYFAI